MNHDHINALAGFGALLLIACPGPDKGGSDSETGSTTVVTSTTGGSTGEVPTTGVASTGVGASTGGEPTSACGRLEASMRPGDERYCICAIEAGMYRSVEACLASLKGDDVEWIDCLCSIEVAEPMYAKYIDCLADAQFGYGVCIEPLSCMEILGLGEQESQCFDAFLAANAVCYKISKEAVLAEEACFVGIPPFMCGSGETIPFVYLCDGVADCADMSDEAGDMCQP